MMMYDDGVLVNLNARNIKSAEQINVQHTKTETKISQLIYQFQLMGLFQLAPQTMERTDNNISNNR